MKRTLVTLTVMALVFGLTGCSAFHNNQLYLLDTWKSPYEAEFSGATVASCDYPYGPEELDKMTFAFMVVPWYPDFGQEKVIKKEAILVIPYLHKEGADRAVEVKEAYKAMPLYMEKEKGLSNSEVGKRGVYARYIPFDDKYVKGAVVQDWDLWECPKNTYYDDQIVPSAHRASLIIGNEVFWRKTYKQNRTDEEGTIWKDQWREVYTTSDMGVVILRYPSTSTNQIYELPAFYIRDDILPERDPDESYVIGKAWVPDPANTGPTK